MVFVLTIKFRKVKVFITAKTAKKINDSAKIIHSYIALCLPSGILYYIARKSL